MLVNNFRKFSIVIPVYNRPDELAELLACLTQQTYRHFDVVIVEDGSTITAESVVNHYKQSLSIAYYVKENGGQGYARNYGLARATGAYFVILDSDALIEPNYLQIVNDTIDRTGVDIYGGPDTDHPSFTPIQKAISYSMTSLFTTGGIRGKKSNLGGTFHPRSFNMGFSRAVWEATGGFQITRMGEDIIFSISAIKAGFKTALIPEAFIYHKRRTSFKQFYKQIHFFGRARINITRYYPDQLKAVHFFPFLYTIGLFSLPILTLISPTLGLLGWSIWVLYLVAIFVDALRITKSLKVSCLSVIASIIQLTGYGIGFGKEGFQYLKEPKNHRETGAQIEYPS